MSKVMPDEKLLSLCQQYGSQAKLWRQKFLGLLPEVNQRKLYIQKGCSSIFEFAFKLGGVSRDQVQMVLNLERRFEYTPQLKQALVSGSVSVNKLARVVSVATPNNQGFWLSQSRLLSKQALETLVRDAKSLPGQTLHTNRNTKIIKILQTDELRLDDEVKKELVELQNKGLDINELLREFLKQRQHTIQHQKEELAQDLEKKEKEGVTLSRYIPAKVKRILQKEFGNKCAHPNCSNQATTIHHAQRFAINPSHNPFYLAPFCKFHHEIAHSIDQRVVEKRKVAFET